MERKEGTESMEDKSSRKRQLRSVFSLCLLLLVLQVLVSVLLCLEIYQMNFLPLRYLAVIGLVLLLMAGIEMGFIARRSRTSYAISVFFSLVFTVCLAVGCVYLQKTEELMRTITMSDNMQIQRDEVAIVVLKDSSLQTVEDLAGTRMGVQKTLDRENTNRVMGDLAETLADPVTVEEYDGISDMVQDLYDGASQSIVINESYRELITDSFKTFQEDVRILAAFNYTTTKDDEIDIKENKQLEEEPFIVYLSGIDTSGEIGTKSRSDVNILAVVNPVSRQILLLTTPRDYYVYLPVSGDKKDKLTHAGIYGIDCSIETLENLYGINIDYYIQANFTGFKNIVNALGGVTVYSEREFTSEIGNYHFKEGNNRVKGKKALAFVRERHAFLEGDVQRARNQMAMIKAIQKKATSPVILTKYTDVLESLENAFITDLTYDDIVTLVRFQLNDNSPWNIQTYSAKGTDTKDITYSIGSKKVWVCVPDEESVAEASRLINRVKSGMEIDLDESSSETE